MAILNMAGYEVEQRSFWKAKALHAATGMPAIAESTSVFIDESGSKVAPAERIE